MIDVERFKRPAVIQRQKNEKFAMQQLIEQNNDFFSNTEANDLTLFTNKGSQSIHISPYTHQNESVMRISSSNVDITGSGGVSLYTNCNIPFRGLHICNSNIEDEVRAEIELQTGNSWLNQETRFNISVHNKQNNISSPYANLLDTSHLTALQNHNGNLLIMPQGNNVSLFTQSNTGYVGVHTCQPRALLHVISSESNTNFNGHIIAERNHSGGLGGIINIKNSSKPHKGNTSALVFQLYENDFDGPLTSQANITAALDNNNMSSLHIITNQEEKLTIDTRGYLGIGVQKPDSHLHICDLNENKAILYLGEKNDASYFFEKTSNGDFQLCRDMMIDEKQVTLLHFNENGHVGLGTNNPIAHLHLVNHRSPEHINIYLGEESEKGLCMQKDEEGMLHIRPSSLFSSNILTLTPTGHLKTVSLSLEGSLHCQNDVHVDGYLDVNKKTTLRDDLEVLQNVNIQNNLDVYKNSFFHSDVHARQNMKIDGMLDITGNTVTNNLLVRDELHVSKQLEVDGTSIFNNQLSIHGPVDIKNELYTFCNIVLYGPAIFENELYLKNKILGTLDCHAKSLFNESVTFKGPIDINGPATIKEEATFKKIAHFKDEVDFEKTVHFKDEVDFEQTVHFKDEVHYDQTVYFTEDVQMDKSLHISGNITVDDAEGLKTNNGFTFVNSQNEGVFFVHEEGAFVGGKLHLNVDFPKHTLDVGGDMRLSGPAYFDEEVFIEKDLRIKGDINGNECLFSNIKSHSFCNSGDAYFKGVSYFEDDVYFKNITVHADHMTCQGSLSNIGHLEQLNNAHFHKDLVIDGDTKINKLFVTGNTEHRGFLVAKEDAQFHKDVEVKHDITVRHDLQIGNELKVGNGLTVSGYVNTSGNITTLGNLLVKDNIVNSGYILTHGHLNVEKDIHVRGRSVLKNELEVYKDVLLRGNKLWVQGNVDILGTLDVGNDVRFKGSHLLVDGDVHCKKDLEIKNNLLVGHDLQIGKKLQVGTDLTVTGYMNADSDINTLGDLIVKGNITNDGFILTHGYLSVEKDLFVNGSTILENQLEVQKDVFFKGDKFFAEGDVDIIGTLKVGQPVELKGSYLHVEGDIHCKENIYVEKNATIGCNLSVLGGVQIDDVLRVENDVSIQKDTSIGGYLDVKKDASFSSNLEVRADCVVLGMVSCEHVEANTISSEQLLVKNDVEFLSNVFIDGNIHSTFLFTKTIFQQNGDELIYATTYIHENGLFVGGKLHVNIDFPKHTLDIGGDFHLTGPAHFDEDVMIKRNLLIDGDIKINGTLDTSDNHLTIASLCNLDYSYFVGPCYFQNDLIIKDVLSIESGKTLFQKDVEIQGKTCLNEIVINNDAFFIKGVDIRGQSLLDDVKVSGTLHLDGSLDLHHDGYFKENIWIDKSLNVKESVRLQDSLKVDGFINAQGNINALGSLRVKDNIENNGRLLTWGNLHVDKKMFVRDIADFKNDVNVLGNVKTQSDIICGKNCHIQKDLNVQRDTQVHGKLSVLKDVMVLKDGVFHANMQVDSNVEIFGDLTVEGKVELEDTLRVKNNLDVQRDTQVHGKLSVLKDVMVLKDVVFHANMQVDSNVEMFGDLTVEGKVELEDTLRVKNNLHVENNTEIIGELKVDDDVLFGAELDVSKNTKLHGNLSVHLDTELLGKMEVQKNVFIGEHLYVEGRVNINNEIQVTDDATFNADVKIEKDVNVLGHLQVSKNIEIDEDLLVRNNLSVENDVSFSSNVSILGELQSIFLFTKSLSESHEEEEKLEALFYIHDDGVFVGGRLHVNTDFPKYDLDIHGDMHVTKDVRFDNHAYVHGKIEGGQDLTIGGNIHGNQDLIIHGVIRSTNGLIVEESNTDVHNLLIRGTLSNDLGMFTHGSLYVTDKIINIGGIHTDNILKAQKIECLKEIKTENLDVSKLNTNILNVTEKLTSQDIEIKENLFCGKDIHCGGSFKNEKSIICDKNIFAKGFIRSPFVDVTDRLHVENDVFFKNGLKVVGDVKHMRNTSIEKNVSVGGGLTCKHHIYTEQDFFQKVFDNADQDSIQPLHNALDILEGIQAYKLENNIGLLGNELSANIPDIIKKINQKDVVSLYGIISVLVQGMNEMITRVKILENQLENQNP